MQTIKLHFNQQSLHSHFPSCSSVLNYWFYTHNIVQQQHLFCLAATEQSFVCTLSCRQMIVSALSITETESLLPESNSSAAFKATDIETATLTQVTTRDYTFMLKLTIFAVLCALKKTNVTLWGHVRLLLICWKVTQYGTFNWLNKQTKKKMYMYFWYCSLPEDTGHATFFFFFLNK